jgi:hypothetical protein
MPSSSKWQQHIECTRLMRQHPDWDDERVLVEMHLHPLEINIVQEARREVTNETAPPDGSSVRSY